MQFTGRFAFALYDIQLQRPAASVLPSPPYDKSTSVRSRLPYFLYLLRFSPAHTPLNGRLRFCSYINGKFMPLPFLPFCILVICFIIFFISSNCFSKRFTWDTDVPDPFAIR